MILLVIYILYTEDYMYTLYKYAMYTLYVMYEAILGM